MNYHEKYRKFYNSAEWQELRKQKWLDANGLCEECLSKGIVRNAREIHHIVPIEQDWKKRLDYDNLQALCPECHNAKHERINELKKFNKIWEGLR